MTKLLDAVAHLFFVAFLIFFAYGFVRYPDAPIRPCGERYCGKQGQPRTFEDYNGFQFWEGLLPWSFVLAFGGAVYLNRDWLSGRRKEK